MEGILLANCNYANSGFVYTPVEVVTNQPQLRYNEAHSRTYVVWDAINLWKRRFKCLQTLFNHKEGIVRPLFDQKSKACAFTCDRDKISCAFCYNF